MSDWRDEILGNLVSLEYGSALEAEARTGRGFRVYGSNGVVGHHDTATVAGPGIIIGRKGSAGALQWSKGDFWPIDTTYWVNSKVDLDLRWMYEALRLAGLQSLNSSTGVPGLNRSDAYELFVSMPPLEEQRQIAEILDTIDGTIHAAERVICKSKAISEARDRDNLANSVDSSAVRLGDVCKILGGKRLPNGHSYVPFKTQYRYLKVEDFFHLNVNYNQLHSLSYSTFDILKRYEIERGELFISIAGSIGYVGVISPPVGLKIILTENAARIVSSKDFVPQYLALQMNSSAVAAQINSEIGTGGGVPKLALHRIANLRVNCPDISEQQEVVRRHEVGRAVWITQEKELEKLKMLRAGLADELLSGRVRTVDG